MKRITLFLIAILLFHSCKIHKTNSSKNKIDKTQNKKQVKVDYLKYFNLIGEASDYYKSKQYEKSALKYEEAFNILKNKSSTSDRYKASCSYALAKNKERAFFHLFYIANNNEFTKLEKLKNDLDLVSLHKDKRWKKLLLIVKQNKDLLEKDFNRELVAILDTVYQNDQDCRIELGFIRKKYGKNSDEFFEKQNKCKRLDSINQNKVADILDNYGWLGKNIIGEKGNTTLFLVLQHSDNNTKMQIKYLPLLKQAVKKGEANPIQLAMLEDRVRLNQGKKQIYGTQIIKNKETGKYFVAPLIDPDNVDKRRAEIGLGPLADYVRNWNINWNVEEYKLQSKEKTKK